MYLTVHSATHDTQGHESEILKILLGETPCPSWLKLGKIEYTVWSEVFTCPDCTGEVVFLEEALDDETKRVKDAFPCPHCGSNLTKDNLQRVFETRPDPASGEPWKRVKFRPSLISYTAGGKRYEKQPDRYDLEILKRIEAIPLPAEIPTNRFPIEQMYHGSRSRRRASVVFIISSYPAPPTRSPRSGARPSAHPDARIRHMLQFFVEQAIWGLSVLNRYGPLHFSQVNRYLTGVYYVASQHSECSPWYILEGKLDRLTKAFQTYIPTTQRGSPHHRHGRAAGAARQLYRLHLHRPTVRRKHLLRRPELSRGVMASGHHQRRPRSHHGPVQAKGPAGVPTPDATVLSGILPGAQAWTLDDGGVPQFQQCCLERHSGSYAGCGFRRGRRADAGQTAGFLSPGDQHRREAGSGDLGL